MDQKDFGNLNEGRRRDATWRRMSELGEGERWPLVDTDHERAGHKQLPRFGIQLNRLEFRRKVSKRFVNGVSVAQRSDRSTGEYCVRARKRTRHAARQEWRTD